MPWRKYDDTLDVNHLGHFRVRNTLKMSQKMCGIFQGERPYRYIVHWKDGNKDNYKAENLRWVKQGTPVKDEEALTREIKRLYLSGMRVTDIGDKLTMHPASIYRRLRK